MTLTPELLTEQLELEDEMFTGGRLRFRRTIESAKEAGEGDAASPGGHQLISYHLDKVIAGVEALVQKPYGRGMGRRKLGVHLIETLPADTVAWIILHEALASTGSQGYATDLARNIGRRLEDEARFRTFRGEKGGLYRVLVEDIRNHRHSGYERARRLLVNRMNAMGVEWQSWAPKDRFQAGVRCVEVLIETTALFEHKSIFVGGMRKRRAHILATESTQKWLEECYRRCESMCPRYMPMLVPPRDWDTPWTGGYLSKLSETTLVKGAGPALLEEMFNTDMPEVYAAINHLQSVAWRINTPQLAVVRALVEAGGGRGGITNLEDTPAPPKVGFRPGVPRDLLTDAERESLQVWKRQAREIHRINIDERSSRQSARETVALAIRFAGRDIYFPHALDWRGRAYPLPLFLQPQGDDLARSLLLFAEGKPLGEQGACWLAIHLSNLWGNDKVSLQERIDWAADNSAWVCRCAQDPFTHREWEDADKPLQFLAAAREWAGYCREGEAYVSHLPIHVDGSCNGLQNFCAALRDDIGGKFVNLIPGDTPQDVYQVVADAVVERLRVDPSPLAAQWLPLINRKVVKRPVMTVCYGAKQYGFADQILDDTLRPLMRAGECPFEDPHAASQILAKHIWEALGEVLRGARACMDWLQTAARVVCAQGLPVWWQSPSGLPILQDYHKMRVVKVESNIQNERVRLSWVEETPEIDRIRQANGIAPNFVHSLDAAHMMSTVEFMWAGVANPSFAAIHDSFGTHASDVEMLNACLRVAFVRQYRNDVLARFRDQIVAQLPEGERAKVPDIPAPGNLDIEAVLDSPFFFA